MSTRAGFDIVYRMRAFEDRASPVERRICRSILDDVEAAATRDIGGLAARAGVSTAAVSRFAKAIGCANLREFRVLLAEAGAVGRRFLDDPQVPAVPALHARICAEIVDSLQRNLHGLDEAVVQAAAARLADARTIHVFGMGGCSAVFAQELQHRLLRLGRPTIASSDALAMRMTAATLGPDDAVLALSVSGSTPELVEAAAIAGGYGARTLAITRAGTPLAGLCAHVLPIVIDETDFVFKPSSSRYAMLLAIDLLATTLGLQLGEPARERLRRIKLALDQHRGGGDDRLPLGD